VPFEMAKQAPVSLPWRGQRICTGEAPTVSSGEAVEFAEPPLPV